jgi:general secretion pathway protein G
MRTRRGTGILVAAAGALALCGTSAKARVAATDLHTLETCLELFRIATGRYPTAEEGLAVLESSRTCKVMRDPWGKGHRYRPPDDPTGPPRVWSTGPDGLDGSADDLLPSRGWLGCSCSGLP